MRNVGEPRRLDATWMLAEGRDGDRETADRLMSALYAELRRIVRGVMASEGQHHALQPAAVVNEAVSGLFRSGKRLGLPREAARADWRSRAHLLAMGARQVRLVLNDYVGTRRGAKSKQRLTITLAATVSGGMGETHDFELVDEMIRRLAETDAELAGVAEMDCFGGMTDREMALVQHSSVMKAKKDRELVRRRLKGGTTDGKEAVR